MKKISLFIENNELVVDSNIDKVPAWLIAVLKENKKDLLKILANDDLEPENVINRLKYIWQEVFGAIPEKDSSFQQLSNSSMDVLKLKSKIFKEFYLDISIGVFYSNLMFSEQVKLITEELSQQ